MGIRKKGNIGEECLIFSLALKNFVRLQRGYLWHCANLSPLYRSNYGFIVDEMLRNRGLRFYDPKNIYSKRHGILSLPLRAVARSH
jgi:hypothetical protein